MVVRPAQEAAAVGRRPDHRLVVRINETLSKEQLTIMTDSVLMIFVKNPRPGRVKTRLAESLGDGKALNIYLQLLHYTLQMVKPLKVNLQVWYSDFIPEDDIWDETGARKKIQTGEDLGERMSRAFRCAFRENYSRAIIIGSDCAELKTEVLEQAFDLLGKKDLVIGPSRDGGYYLLGMKQLHEELFIGKSWSTPALFNQTVRDIHRKKLTYDLLPVLSDVDTGKDWKKVKDDFLKHRQ